MTLLKTDLSHNNWPLGILGNLKSTMTPWPHPQLLGSELLPWKSNCPGQFTPVGLLELLMGWFRNPNLPFKFTSLRLVDLVVLFQPWISPWDFLHPNNAPVLVNRISERTINSMNGSRIDRWLNSSDGVPELRKPFLCPEKPWTFWRWSLSHIRTKTTGVRTWMSPLKQTGKHGKPQKLVNSKTHEPFQGPLRCVIITVDGWNPAPPGIYETL